MGTDIHAIIEYKENGIWKTVMFPNKYAGKWGGEEEYTGCLDINRDYPLFAILGNVCNGVGFAGVDTGDAVEPMSDCRGLPEDVSDGIKYLSNEHSQTWVSLKEILAYNWTKTSKHRGVVSMEVFEHWDRVKEWNPVPSSWCGDVSGKDVLHVTNLQARELIQQLEKRYKDRISFNKHLVEDFPSTYTKIEWEISYAKAGSQIWTAILPYMLKYGKEVGYENVRLVMDFDS